MYFKVFKGRNKFPKAAGNLGLNEIKWIKI